MKALIEWALGLAKKLEWAGPLLIRLAIGYMFFLTGWGKLHNIDKVTGFFDSLGIPYPHLNAVIAASTECFGGLLIMVGLCTRLVSIPLAFVMVVAIGTAKMGDVKTLGDFAGLSELAYLLIFVWLALAGPGKASFDYLLCKAFCKDSSKNAA